MSDSIATQINPECIAAFWPRSLRQAAEASRLMPPGNSWEASPLRKKGLERSPFTGWKHWLAARVEELASAIAFGRLEISSIKCFRRQDRRSKRGIDWPIFRQGLVCLRTVEFFWRNFPRRCGP